MLATSGYDPAEPPVRARPLTHAYDAAYRGVPNWDIGRPQAAFVALAEAGYVRGPVLDVGCGTGALSLYLAERHRTLGIDLSAVAVARAREAAARRGSSAQFLVWDALSLSGLAAAGLHFRTVVDSAMFHALGDHERDRLAAQLETVLEPGGRYCVLGDARRADEPIGYGITPAEIRRRFERAGGWTVELAVETGFDRRWSQNTAYLVVVKRRGE